MRMTFWASCSMTIPWLWMSVVSGDSYLASIEKSVSLTACIRRGTPYSGGQMSWPWLLAGSEISACVPVRVSVASPYGSTKVQTPASSDGVLKSSETMPAAVAAAVVKVMSPVAAMLAEASSATTSKW